METILQGSYFFFKEYYRVHDRQIVEKYQMEKLKRNKLFRYTKKVLHFYLKIEATSRLCETLSLYSPRRLTHKT